ncbi:hypothetical protein CQA15_29375, partial [Klebsiella pneumoniae]
MLQDLVLRTNEVASVVTAAAARINQLQDDSSSNTQSAAALTRTSDEQAEHGYAMLQDLVLRTNEVASVVTAAAARINQLQDDSS